jgi:hypothetical protein
MASDNSQYTGQDAVFGPPVEGRECGECVACCKILGIDVPELAKPAGVLCQHCTGTGCGIYQTRPQQCRDWHCAWRRIGAMPPATRPDRLGVMFDLVRPEPAPNILARLYILGHAIDPSDDFSNPLIDHVVNMFRQARIPIWIQQAERMFLVHPSREIAEILVDGKEPASPELAREAEEWRVRCESL